jgi:hypothetical protein
MIVTQVTIREVWWASVVAGVRSKFGAALLAVGLALSVWLFAVGNVILALVEVALVLLIYARIPVAIGAALGARSGERRT